MEKIKKILFLLLLFSFGSTHAGNITYTAPIVSDMNSPVLGTASLGQRIGYTYSSYAQFCINKGGDYISSTSTNVTTSRAVYSGTAWNSENAPFLGSHGVVQSLVCYIPTPGCTYNTATNYSTGAEIDDGSCIYNNTGSTQNIISGNLNTNTSYTGSVNILKEDIIDQQSFLELAIYQTALMIIILLCRFFYLILYPKRIKKWI